MGILNQFFEKTNIVLLCTKEFITLTEEYDRLQEIADNKFREIMEYITKHPKEFAAIKNLGEINAQKEGTKEANS